MVINTHHQRLPNFLYSFSPINNTNMFTQRVKSLKHSVSHPRTVTIKNPLTNNVCSSEKRPHKKERLQASTVGRSGQYNTSANPLQITLYHITRRGHQKEGERGRGREGRRKYLPVFCRPLRCRRQGFVWRPPRPEWRWSGVQWLSSLPGWGGRGRWHRSGGDPTQNHQPQLNRCLCVYVCVSKVLYLWYNYSNSICRIPHTCAGGEICGYQW